MSRDGASVALSGRRAAVLEAAAGRLGSRGPVSWTAGDASDEGAAEHVVASAAKAMGGLDTVVIAAGTSGRTPITATDMDSFQRILDHNVRPVFLACLFATPHLIANGAGALIAISSMYGLVGQRERAAYCAAKSAVIGLIRAIALDLAEHGIRANAICPGFIETDLARQTAAQEADPEAALRTRRAMHPIPRAGRPEEVGAMAAYLASDDGAFVSGQALAVDGGYTAR
jgi:meso-butanediol dehydrogenase/(S,S)-butanediol dehydrogenase/diacetyl reductase